MKMKAINLSVGLALFFLVSQAFAGSGLDSADLFDNLLNRFYTTASTWAAYLKSSANWLFWSLVTISMAWTYGLMVLRKSDLQEFFAETVQFLVVTGFFYWILDNGPLIATSIMDTLRLMAAKASGLDKLISPSSIVDVGFDIVSRAIDHSSIWSPANTTVGLIIAGIILIAFALVAVNMLIVLISAWIIIYGGIFLLGFGGGRWTQDIAINYYKTVLGIALQAFSMVLLIGIGKSFIDQYYAALGSDITLKEMFVMLVVSIILVSIINKVTPMLSSIVSGGGNGGGGGIGFGAAMGAASLAGAALASGASIAASSAANISGAGSALSAAFKAASQGMGMGGNDNGFGSEGKSSSFGGLKAAMGEASQFASSFGSHLYSGATDVMRDKMDSIKESISSRVAETPGGKVADAINERAQGSDDKSESSNDSLEGSLSAGASTASDEISDFVNKDSAKGD